MRLLGFRLEATPDAVALALLFGGLQGMRFGRADIRDYDAAVPEIPDLPAIGAPGYEEGVDALLEAVAPTPFPRPIWPDLEWAIGAGVAIALVTLVSILLHELGHALAARRCGVDVDRIALAGFGGVVEMEDDDRLRAGTLALIVGAGPAVTALLAGVCLGALLLLGWPLWGDPIAHTSGLAAAQVVLQAAFLMNAAGLVINLFPRRPLDGGHLLVALKLRLAR